MQIDSKIDPRWCEAILSMLEGDLNHNRIAEVKTMLRTGIDSIRKSRTDTPAATELSHLLNCLPNKIPDGSGGFVDKPVGFLDELISTAARGCLFSGPRRGDCEHDVGLPGKSIPGRHDGPDDTVDEYGRPNGWCEICWRGRQIHVLEHVLSAYAKSCGGQKHAVDTAKSVKQKAKMGMLG